jgi:hypothetical protein
MLLYKAIIMLAAFGIGALLLSLKMRSQTLAQISPLNRTATQLRRRLRAYQ